MSIASLRPSKEPLHPAKNSKKGRKRKSGIIGNERTKSLSIPVKRQRSLRKNQLDARKNLKLEGSEDEKVEGHEKLNGEKQSNNTELTNPSVKVSSSQEGGRELVCRICRKKSHDLNHLALHEKIPHFWSCTHRGCELAFETKVDRIAHVEEFHAAEQFTGGNTELDHLVMNSDGTMSFNYLTSATTKRRSRHHHHQEIDLSLLAKNSDYGGNRVKNNGYTSRVNYRTRTKNEKWNKDDTTKFYKNLSIYGCNFALLAALFKGRSRKQLKNKYKKEERENPKLIKNALTNRQPMELNIDEFEEIVTENMKAKQTLAQKADGGGDIIKKKKAVKATVQKRKANRLQKTATKVPQRETSITSVREQRLQAPARQLKRELCGTTPLLELGPPPGAEERKLQDDESSDYEFDPFA